MKKRRWILIAALIAGVILFDRFAAVRPEMPPQRQGDPEPARPQPGDPPFQRTPIAPTFEARRQLYLEWLLPKPTPDERGGVWMDIAKLAAGAESISPAAFRSALDFVNVRQDPSDFYLTALLRLYYLNAGNGKLTPDQETAIRDALLNYKYWLDEPNTTYVEMWTENHQILIHSAEYLAGQLFPEQTFSNNGQTGRWHMDHARKLNLVDFAEDQELATRAAMMVDALLFDIAVDSFYGQYATSHGRVTASSIKSAAGGSVTTLAALVWGQGRFQSTSNMGVVAMATTARYRPPAVIEALALDMLDEYLNYERHSFPVEKAPDYGLDPDQISEAPRYWSMGAFTTPERIDMTIRAADEWQLWHYPDFRDLKDIAKILQAVNGLPLASSLLDPDPNGILMSEVNKVTYRTPDAMLSSAQDFRKGEKGYQQHIWQATLSPYALVFTNNPDSMRADDKHRPSYWMSNGRMPRTGQYKNVLVALYDIDRYPSAPPPLEARHNAFTHAYFPRWAFDQIVEMPVESGGGWIFGRSGDGYIGLYSHLPYVWTTSGPDADQEVIALGRRNVWIAQIGRAVVDGSFDDFIRAVTQANLTVDGLRVNYQAPGVGQLSFDWNGPLTLDGELVPLSGYQRWENPYAQVEFGSLSYHIRFAGKELVLDFASGTREIKD